MNLFLFLFGAVVEGRVWSFSTQEPLAGCNVYIEGEYLGSAADSTGYYRIEKVKPGDYTLVFSMVGYKIERRRIKIEKDNQLLTVNVELIEEPIKLEKIIIDAKREEFQKEATPSTYKVSKSWMIRELPSFIEADIFRVFQVLPGVGMVSDFSNALYVRGGAPDQNLVLLDMIPLFNPFHLGGLFSTFPMDIVKEACFMAGGFPVCYGGRLSSVLDIKTYSGEKNEPSLNINQSLFSTGISGEYFISKFSFAFAGRRTYFDKLLPLFGVDFPYYFYDFIFSSCYKLTEADPLGITLFKSEDKFDLELRGTSLHFKWQNELLGGRYKRIFSENFLYSFWIGRSIYKNYFKLAGFIADTNIIDKKIIQTQLLWTKEDKEILAGFEYHWPYFYYGVHKLNIVNFTIEGSDVKEVAGYLQYKWKPFPSFLLLTGVRVDHFGIEYKQAKRYYKFSPRVSLKYFFNAENAFVANIGRYYQFYTMILPEGGRIQIDFWLPVYDDYPPLSTDQFILGWHNLRKDNIEIRLEGYYKYYHSLLDFNEYPDLLSPIEDLFFKGKGEAAGLDLLLKKDMGRLKGWISYSLGFSIFETGDSRYYASFDRRHNFNIMGSYEIFKDLDLNIKWAFASGNPYTDAKALMRGYRYCPATNEYRWIWWIVKGRKNGMRFPSYHRLDLGISKEWEFNWCKASLKFDIINVYNRRNIFFYYYEYDKTPPRKREVSMIPIFPSIGVEVRFR